MFSSSATIRKYFRCKKFAQAADIDAFNDLPFVLIKKGNRTRSIIDQFFNGHNFSPKLILETENTVTTLVMAQSGIGITICPELFLLAMPAGTGGSRDVDIFPLTDPATSSNLVAGYRPDRYLSHFGERFIELAQESFQTIAEVGPEA